MSSTEITAAEFFARCERHDWQWAMSDDHSKYKAGETEHATLLGMAHARADLYRIMAAFTRSEWYGHDAPVYADLVPPKPSIPTELHPQQTTLYDFID